MAVTLILGQEMLSRQDFQNLAERKLKEAQALLAAQLYDGAYYLVGYVVEFGLKACIAKKMQHDHFFPHWDFVRKCYTHDPTELVNLAELKSAFDNDRQNNPKLDLHWLAIKQWSEQKRYDAQTMPAQQAIDALTGVADSTDGVLAWIKKHW